MLVKENDLADRREGSLHESALSVRHLGRSMNGLRAGMSAPPLMAAARVAAGVRAKSLRLPGLSRTAAVDPQRSFVSARSNAARDALQRLPKAVTGRQ